MAAWIKKTFLGPLAGWVLSLFGKSPIKSTEENFRQIEFKTSTQRIGVRFTDKIHRVFRFRWTKKH